MGKILYLRGNTWKDFKNDEEGGNILKKIHRSMGSVICWIEHLADGQDPNLEEAASYL